MNWLVNMDFKRGPALSLEINALTEGGAIGAAMRLAPQYGFKEQLKKGTRHRPNPLARLLTDAEVAERRGVAA